MFLNQFYYFHFLSQLEFPLNLYEMALMENFLYSHYLYLKLVSLMNKKHLEFEICLIFEFLQ